MKSLALFLIKGYQLFLSPFLGNNCRFAPSCSVYTAQAIEQYGVLKGSFLGFKRILRCHP
ncbi:membrane protein insertion efficiency factor YidD [Candidatus Shapirobacteria bacterium]|nr:membrane protein insertion efficiency factor YidD [Candidatus Shapirobacteria bacterium]